MRACLFEEKYQGCQLLQQGEFAGNTWVFCVYCSRQLGCNPTPNNTESLWVAYGGMQAMGYTDLTINHTCEFVDPVPGAYTQNMENSRENAKLSNKKKHGTHRIMLDSYLCERMWQQQHRNDDKFDQIIADIVTHFWPM